MTLRRNRSSRHSLRQIVRQIWAMNAHICADLIQKIIDEAVAEVRADRRPRPRPHIMRAYRASLAKHARLYRKLAGLPDLSPTRRGRKSRKRTPKTKRK